jgi:hypothetical protein
MVVKIQVTVFWVVLPCSSAVGYECLGAPCCLHLDNSENLNLNLCFESVIVKQVFLVELSL